MLVSLCNLFRDFFFGTVHTQSIIWRMACGVFFFKIHHFSFSSLKSEVQNVKAKTEDTHTCILTYKTHHTQSYTHTQDGWGVYVCGKMGGTWWG